MSEPAESTDEPSHHRDEPSRHRGDPATWAVRVCVIGLLLSQWWKYRFFIFAAGAYRQITIDDPFFPDVLREPRVLIAAFLTATVGYVLSFRDTPLRTFLLSLSLAAVTVMCLHQGGYNDATFTTMWWANLMTIWLSHRSRREAWATLGPRAAWLGRLIVSMILLGGAVGKWTPEYWSGEVLYEIYFVDRDFWVFNGLRQWCDEDTRREIATWYSRSVVVTETVFGLTLWALPRRVASQVGMLLLTSIVVFSNFLLMSVMACLIAILAVGLFPVPGRSDGIGVDA